MTDKRIPRRYRDQLVPSGATGVPEPVATANEELRIAALAAEDAFTRRREAEAAARKAPRHDAETGIEAVRKGGDPPPATAPEREKEAELARQREKAAKSVAARAATALERLIREHSGEWIEPQRADAKERLQEALDVVDALGDAVERLEESAGTVASLQTSPTGKAIEGRFFKRRTLGGHEAVPHLLDELREAIRRTVPEPLSTLEDTPEELDLKRRARAWRQFAQGGVHVSGDAA
jgi:hypothetical protein